MNILYNNFISYLKGREPTFFHIILHHNADPDAICAAEVFGFLIASLDNNHDYRIYSDDINQTASRIMKELAITVENSEINPDPDKDNCVLTVDTANLSQLGKYASWVDSHDIDLLVVDHHDTSELADRAVVSIVDTNSSSTCVLADLSLQAADVQATPRIATLILSGHMYDSRRMLYGTTSDLLARFSQLLALGGDFELANELLQTDMSHGEKIARFKAAQRLKYHSIKDVIVVTSKVGAFEASAARSFIGLGADITFILAPKDTELRGSARCLNHLDINIGEIMSALGKEFDGTGGGHAAAAGFNIAPVPSNKQQKKILKRFVEMVEEVLV